MSAHPRQPARVTQRGLSWFNALPAESALVRLLACCSSGRWATLMAAGRPYASIGAVLRRSGKAVASLTVSDLQDALSDHPRIGETAGARSWSRQEQSGVSGSDEATMRAIAEHNVTYEERFGHIYLVCATGRDARELLEILRARLANDPDSEWLVVRSELDKINRIRLRQLIAAGQ